VLQASNFDLRLSAGSPPNANTENGNTKLPSAQPAPRASNLDLRPSILSPRLTPPQLQFLLRVSPAALAGQLEYGIPACVTIAQAVFESATAAGWGSSVLFRLANNPFGIKYCHFGAGYSVLGAGENPTPQGAAPSCGSPAPSAQHPEPKDEDYGHFDAQTWEIVNGQKKVMIAEFQRFPNLEEAFRAHALLLRSPRYRPAFAVRDDWKQFAERLGPKSSPLDTEHCGYSTNPSYSAELCKLVSLYRLDDPRALQWFATGKDPGNLAIGSSDHLTIGSLQQSTNDPPMNHDPLKSSSASG